MNDRLRFSVPQQKRVRVIVVTDCKNEADDAFALAHHLMTPKFDVRAVIAAHFEEGNKRFAPGTTAQESLREIETVLSLMGMDGQIPVCLGASVPMPDERTPVDSPGARKIIEEAMKDSDMPLYVAALGGLTDVASALLIRPEIGLRMTVIWIGGGAYPQGGWEFNLFQDIHAVNAVFDSDLMLWQVPRNVYKLFQVSLAELQMKVYPHGEIGRHLFEQMVRLNEQLADSPNFPHGETWCLGDQPTVGVLLEDRSSGNYTMRTAPHVLPDGRYEERPGRRKIRVYHAADVRLTLEDFFAKLAICFGTTDDERRMG